MERAAAAALVVSTLAGLGLAAVYVAGGQPQAEGVLLALCLGGLGVALGLWGKEIGGSHGEAGDEPGVVTDERVALASPDERRADVAATLERGGRALDRLGRRRFLGRFFLAAGGALGLAALFPLRSLGPTPGGALRRTAWRAGSRATSGGRPVRARDLEVGSVITVFPDDDTSEDSATLLIRVDPEALVLAEDRADWAPEGIVAYSKICTHVGCPVGLYRETTNELLCPCHQSTFDVLRGARPTFGPATRALPQLPIEIDDEGHVVARSDYQEPIGPGFWNREDGR